MSGCSNFFCLKVVVLSLFRLDQALLLPKIGETDSKLFFAKNLMLKNLRSYWVHFKLSGQNQTGKIPPHKKIELAFLSAFTINKRNCWLAVS